MTKENDTHVLTWEGVPITDLSREQLVEALEVMFRSFWEEKKDD